MNPARAIRSALIRRFADPARLQRQRQRAEAARQRAGRAHELLYFHQVDDPYSQLAVQALAPLLARYDLAMRVHVVANATPIAIHEQALWDRWAQRDCALIAPHYGLAYAAPTAPADAALLDQARRLALAFENGPDFGDAAMTISRALQQGAAAPLAALAITAQPLSPADAARRLDENFRLRHRLGHYLGGMFHYQGEWYWGIDRLHYLEARLDALGARRADAPPGPSVARRTASVPPRIATTRRLRLEFYASLRSPYTQISYGRVADLCARYPVDLVLRPVIPMMMRGVKADRRKGIYIIEDTAREAARLGLAFGNACDPFGKPVLRGYSLFPWARDQGRGFEYLRAFSDAVWTRRVDAYAPSGLRGIVEQAGLDWVEARKRLDNRDWEAELEANVQAMIAAGSWGVPTLRLLAADGEPDFTVWGQDRIWLIDEEINRRLGTPAR